MVGAMDMSRDDKVRELAQRLYVNVCEGDLERIRTTGALTPTNNLRHRATRQKLQFTRDLDGRWFTYQMVSDAVRYILSDFQLEIPSTTPGFQYRELDSTDKHFTVASFAEITQNCGGGIRLRGHGQRRDSDSG